MEGCTFCEELSPSPGMGLFEALSTDTFSNRVIWENDNFAIMPTIGCFIEGYIILVTKRHLSTFGAISLRERENLNMIFPSIISVMEAVYGGCTFFEHGSVEGCSVSSGGACEDHAHIHFLPRKFDFSDQISSLFEIRRLFNLEMLSEHEATGTPYLMFGNSVADMMICDAFNIRSQFLRILACQQLGRHDTWNWRINPFTKKMENTYNALKLKLEHLT